MLPEHATLDGYLASSNPTLLRPIMALATVAIGLAHDIATGPLRAAHSAKVGQNADGDGQTSLDVAADEAFIEALAAADVRWFASEERETISELDGGGHWAVAIDPLDGSSNIDTNVSIGTIFSIFDARADGEASFLRPGREQAAAGYIIYGPQTAMILTVGEGVALFVLDRERGFVLVGQDLRIPPHAAEFAINASNYRHWSPPIRAYIDDCLAGSEGPRGINFNMRWIASLVAEAHRIMVRGGIFLYPADSRDGYQKGRLRHVYECAPIALLVERAGGLATDACDAILDKVPASLHARTPFVFGSREKVARVAAYHEMPDAEVAPLFGRRGLFTV